MATLAQALELKKKNPNLSTRDAIAQVEGIGTSSMNTANPPVTPPTPTPTGQTMQGVNNETFQVAPINQQTGLSTPTQTQAPTQPTSTTTPTQTAPIQAQNTPTPESTIAGIQTPTSTPEVKPTPIKSPEELKREEISAKNKAQIELNRQKSELAREDRKLQTDEANNALANDETAILNTLKSGGIIPEVVKTSPYYKSAQNTYRQIQNFRTMSQSQLSTALSNGSLLPGTSTYNELIKDPTMEARIKEARIYATPVDSNKVLVEKSGEILSQNSKVAQFLDDGILSLDEYNQMTNNSDVVAQAKLKQEKEQSLNAFNKEWSDAREKAKKEFAGSAFLDSILSDIDSGYKTRYDYLKGEVDIATGTLAELKSTATALFEKNIDNYVAYRNSQIAVDQTRATNAVNLQNAQAQFEQKIKQEAEAMNDPTQAINSVIAQYADQGIMASTSAQQHIAEFMKQNREKGTTLGQYISQMQKDFQAKPEYKAKFAQASTQDWQKLTDTTLYNQKTGEIRNLSGTSGGLPSSFTGDTTSYIAAKEGFRSQAYQDSAGVWTIGYGTTRINGKPVQPGQTITQAEAQKLLEEDIARHSNWKNFIDESTLSPSQRTALASFEYNLGPGIWEKSAMNIIDMVKSGDLAGASKEMQKYTNAGGRFVQGLANRRAEEAQLLMNTGAKAQGQKQFTDNDIALLSSVTKLDKQGKETLNNAGFTEQDWANFNAGLLPPTSAQKTDAQAVVDSIDDILGSDWTNAVGTWKGLPLPGTDRTVVEKKVNALIDNLAMSNLDKLKGPMSDKDIAFLRNTATYLSTDLSEDEFSKTLDLIKTKYAKIAGGVPKSQPLQPMQTNTGAGQISQQHLAELQKILNP